MWPPGSCGHFALAQCVHMKSHTPCLQNKRPQGLLMINESIIFHQFVIAMEFPLWGPVTYHVPVVSPCLDVCQRRRMGKRQRTVESVFALNIT